MDTGNPYLGQITDAANKYGVDPTLALGVANQESGFNNKSVSPKGAQGIFQLMPDTAKGLGVDPTDPAQNIDGGVRYLKQMQDRYKDPQLALAAYNAGPGRVDDYLNKGRPLPDETTNYVKSISGSLINQAFAQGRPMPDPNQQPVMAQAQQPDPSTLFGGNPTPVGGIASIARMLGIGSEPQLGNSLKNAGAALQAPGNWGRSGAAGAAALQEAANQPHFNVVTDALGNRFMVDTRTGSVVSPSGGGMNQAGGGGPGGAQPQGMSQALAQTPVALAKRATDEQEASTKKMSDLEDSAAQAQGIIDQNNYALKLSQDPGTVQGPGLWNMLKEKTANFTNGSFGGVDIAKQAELDKINSNLVGSMLSAQKGIRFAAPEIKFGETASADTEKPALANQQIYSNNIQNAQRVIDARDIARAHMAKYGVLGPEYSTDLQTYQKAHPIYQGDAVKPNSGSGANRPPLSSFQQ